MTTPERFHIEWTDINDRADLWWCPYRDYDEQDYFSFETIDEAREYVKATDRINFKWRIVRVTWEVVE